MLILMCPPAQGEDLELIDSQGVSHFVIGPEISQISSSQAKFTGFGMALGFRYAFSQHWGIQSNLSQALHHGSGGFGYLFTGFNGMVSYAFFGSWMTHQREIRQGGGVLIRQRSNSPTTGVLSLGLDQLLLSGAQSVYPATGVSLKWESSFHLFDRSFVGSLRTGIYDYSGQSLTVFFLGLSVPLAI